MRGIPYKCTKCTQRENTGVSPADITIVTWRAVDETDRWWDTQRHILTMIILIIDILLKRGRGTMSREYSAGRTSCVERKRKLKPHDEFCGKNNHHTLYKRTGNNELLMPYEWADDAQQHSPDATSRTDDDEQTTKMMLGETGLQSENMSTTESLAGHDCENTVAEGISIHFGNVCMF